MAGANKKWTVLCCWAMLPICIVSAKGAHHAAAAPAPTAAIDCSSALVSLVDCLSFVQEGSREGKPQGQCCPGLKEVVKDEVSCLYQVFKGSADYGVKLNMTKALTLPSACGVKTPPFSKCNIAIGGAPGAAPVSSPAGAPSSSSSIGQSAARAPATSPVHSAAANFLAQSLIQLTIAATLFCNHL